MIIKNKEVILVSLSFFFIFFGFGAAQQFIVPIFNSTGEENTALFSLILIYTFFSVTGLVTPSIISRIGFKSSLIVSSVFYGLYILSIISKNDLLLYVFSIAIGISASLLWTSGAEHIMRSSGKKKHGEALGFQQSMGTLGKIWGISLTTLFLTFLSNDIIFLLLSIFVFFGVFLFFPIKRFNTSEKKIEVRQTAKMFLDKRILLILPIVFSTFFLRGLTISSIPLMVGNLHGLIAVGVISMIFQIGFIIFSYLTGKLSDIVRRELLIYVGIFLAIAGTVMFICFEDIIITAVAISLISFYTSLAYPTVQSMMRSVFGVTSITTALFQTFSSVGVLFSIISTLFLREIVSFYFSIVLCFVALVAVFLFQFLNR